jgi:hypothetical protein
MPATYEPISSITLGASTSSVIFNSIPQTYTDLVLKITASPSTNGVTGYMRLNSDTGSNYSMVGTRGNGTDTASYRQTSLGYFFFDYAGNTNIGTTTLSTVNFLDYSSTNKHKTNLVRQSNASDVVEMLVQKWSSNSAITSITIFWSSGDITSGSTFHLYGIKAA